MKYSLSKYKKCRNCRIWKIRKSFGTSKANKDKLKSYCKPCALVKTAKWKKGPKFAKWQRAYVLKPYKISVAQYTDMLKKQKGICAICLLARFRGKETTLHVDHDHDTGVIRGLLCHICNTTLGKYETWKEEINKYLGGVSETM